MGRVVTRQPGGWRRGRVPMRLWVVGESQFYGLPNPDYNQGRTVSDLIGRIPSFTRCDLVGRDQAKRRSGNVAIQGVIGAGTASRKLLVTGLRIA